MNRLSTGLPDLDLVLGGGLEPGRSSSLAGPPGTGKTILAQQICFANATAGTQGHLLHDPVGAALQAGRAPGSRSPSSTRGPGPTVEYIHLGDLLRDGPADGLEPLVTEVVRKAMEERAGLVVIDSAKMLRDFVGERELRTASTT